MTRNLAVETLCARSFRNLSCVDLELGPGFNVFSGDNGQGKTNVLEALYLLATSKSFRTAKLSDLVQSGALDAAEASAERSARTATVRALVREDGVLRSQSVGVRGAGRSVRIDGQRVTPLAAYAVRTPTVIFHPGAVALSSGSGAERRKLLDRLALYLAPASLGDAAAYGRAARARHRVLVARGECAPDLDGWEHLMCQHGSLLSHAREQAVARLAPAAERAFARIGSANLALRARYVQSAPASQEAFREALARARPKDRARGWAGVGPHRDELALELGGRAVRGTASQGQHRAIVLALELAEIDVVGDARGVRPLLLLDDVSSELDRTRTAALFRALNEDRGQVFVTTTRPDVLGADLRPSPIDRRDFVVVDGQVATVDS
ncbi:MAG: DNA replication and repair protein RecF [Myxococcota bacterium]|nr:DNA replication and repair protein RecF [Myxococcota bacterium]